MPMRAMKVIVGVVSATAVLMAPGAASAATTKCRIEKPARATYGSLSSTVYLDHLTATDVPQRSEGPQCALANELAFEFENHVIEYGEAPGVLETDGWEERAPVEFFPDGNELDFSECSEERETAIFTHGRQRVSWRVRLRWDELPVYCEGEGSGSGGGQ